MPVNAYYKGHGNKVMAAMLARYGAKHGKEVFYATARKRGLEAPKKKRSKHRQKLLENYMKRTRG